MPTVAAVRKKPARNRGRRRGPAPLPLRVLACFLAVPSNALLLCVAMGWYVGVAWLAPPAWWPHTVAYTSVVLGFFGAFLATWKTAPGVHQSPVTADDCEQKRWCEFCDAPKPWRTYHCRICNVCVFRRDHHCDSVDNCVGLGNHGFFVLLLALQVVACWYYMWLFHHQSSVTVHPPSSSLYVFGWARRVITTVLYGVALCDVLYVGRLLIWQVAYLCHDITTLEHLRVAASARASASEAPGLRDVARNMVAEMKTLPALPPPASGQPVNGAGKLLLLLQTYKDDTIALLRFLLWQSAVSIANPRDTRGRLLSSIRVVCRVLLFRCKRT